MNSIHFAAQKINNNELINSPLVSILLVSLAVSALSFGFVGIGSRRLSFEFEFVGFDANDGIENEAINAFRSGLSFDTTKYLQC